MIYHFTALTINCERHSIRSMFRVLGIYAFDQNVNCIICEPRLIKVAIKKRSLIDLFR